MVTTDIIIEPLVGLAGVKLGAPKAEVTALLGTPERIVRGKNLVYFGGALRIHLDREECVCFMEVAGGLSVCPVLGGVRILDVTADDAIRAIGHYGAVDTTHPEYPLTCIVRDVELSVWRHARPSDDPQTRPGATFESVGIGKKGYFSGAFHV